MGALMGSGALALWLDVAPELDRETDGWYIDEHMPERLDIGGYLRARRYEALAGAPAYLTLFEASTPAALASEGYLKLVKKISPQSQHIRAGFSNVARNTFEVRASVGRGIGAVMSSVRLKAPEPARGADAAAAIDAKVPLLFRQNGVVGVHWLQAAPAIRAQMDAVRAVGQADAAVDYVLFIEATRAADAQAAMNRLLPPEMLTSLGWPDADTGLYTLLYEVSGGAPDAASLPGPRT